MLRFYSRLEFKSFFFLFIIFFLNSNLIFSQCQNPVIFQVNSTTINSTIFQWSSVDDAQTYRISYRTLGGSWQFATNPIDIPSTSDNVELTGLDENTTYQYRIKTFCLNGEISSWSTVKEFTTLSSVPLDCNGDLQGEAFIDDCGNCVGGNTSLTSCIDFTPEITLTLSQYAPATLSDISFTISQNANEPDMASSMFVSDGGSFDILSLSLAQSVGQGYAEVGGGFLASDFTLYVSSISGNSNATLTAVDNNNGSVYATFELENTDQGVLVTSIAPSDDNNITNGNNLSVTLSEIYYTPQAGSLTFYTTINSEFSEVDSQSFDFVIGIPDCNGEINGEAFLDDCGNCVGGNTGLDACVDFNPSIVLTLSSTDCNVTSDIFIEVSQSANQPDILSSLIISDGGSFDFSSISINQNIGFTSLQANSGDINFEASLIVSSLLNDEAILSAVDVNDGSIMGSFTISNEEEGISIVAVPSYDDGNNVTGGNVSSLTLNGLFVNPAAQTLNFSATINSENNDIGLQSVSVEIECPCSLSGDSNCDNIVNLADLTLVLNNWLQEVEPGTNGDVNGSSDGFVNLDDLTLVLNNWLSTN